MSAPSSAVPAIASPTKGSPPSAAGHPSPRPPALAGGLRRRLLVSYAVLIGVSVFLSSLASLLLFARRAGQESTRELSDQAATLANMVETLAQSAPLTPPVVMAGLFADARLRESGQPLLLLDASGHPLLSLHPPPPAAGRRPQPGGFRRGIRRPAEPDALYPPLAPTTTGRPATAALIAATGRRLIYATVALPDDVARAFNTLLPTATSKHLAIVRPRLNLVAALRGILPSVLLVGAAALLLASLLAFVLAGSITRPVDALTAATVRLAAGDYTARVRPARDGELARLGEAFNQMAARVQEADARQREFVANVSHDLRTPLTTVRGFSRALVDGTARTEDQRRRAAEAIDAASERMAGLVESLLELARLEGRGAVGAPNPVLEPLAPLLAAAVAAAQGAAAAAGVAVHVDCAPELFARADRDWLGRALGNVLDNALRFSPRGETVEIHAALRQPDAADGPALIDITVEDRGPGIAAADLPRVFERFYRGDPARQAGGSGLGLAIAKEIVEAHGGRIDIGKRRGAGTKVVISLPAGGEAGPLGVPPEAT